MGPDQLHASIKKLVWSHARRQADKLSLVRQELALLPDPSLAEEGDGSGQDIDMELD